MCGKRGRPKSANAAGTTEPPKRRKVSDASRTSRSAWQIAADWVEAFSPTIFGPLDRPHVVLVDDVAVHGQDLDRIGKRTRRDAGYFVLVLAELHWPEPSPDDDPMVGPQHPVIQLRLVRAMAKSNTPAWRRVGRCREHTRLRLRSVTPRPPGADRPRQRSITSQLVVTG